MALGFFPGPRTPLAAVAKLLPGHVLIVDDNGVRNERYWEYPAPRDRNAPHASVDEVGDRLIEELDEAVRLRLMSDVPLGAMLSGGLDSSLVVALMARHMSEPVKTFSIGFVEAGDANELDDARFVARIFGTEHHELELSIHTRTSTWPSWSGAWRAARRPLELGFYALSELAARHVTVALSGQGADELLGGYMKHRAARSVTPGCVSPGRCAPLGPRWPPWRRVGCGEPHEPWRPKIRPRG